MLKRTILKRMMILREMGKMWKMPVRMGRTRMSLRRMRTLARKKITVAVKKRILMKTQISGTGMQRERKVSAR